jgi:hypothetical protein
MVTNTVILSKTVTTFYNYKYILIFSHIIIYSVLLFDINIED